MGLGGALLWTGAIANLSDQYPSKKLVVVSPKRLKSWLLGKRSDNDLIFSNNPRVHKVIPSCLFRLYRPFLKNVVLLNLTDPKLQHHVPDHTDSHHVTYRAGKHAIEYALIGFECGEIKLRPEIYLSKKEHQKGNSVLRNAGLADKEFLCVEPNTKNSFTPNKSWPWERWQELVNCIRQDSHVEIVQLGAPESRVLESVINLTGTLTFRENAVIIEKSRLLVNVISGLTHLARAVNTKNVTLVSAWEPKGLATYPDDIVFYKEQECQHCGLLSPCPFDIKCMKEIRVEEVCSAILKELIEVGQ